MKKSSGKCRHCVLKCPELREKMRQTLLLNYGVEHPSQNLDIKEKMKKTNMERYGVEHPSQNLDIKEKMKKTNMERYGATEGRLAASAVEYSLQSSEVREKSKKTFRERYGVDNPMQCPEIFQKWVESSYCKKPFMVAGKLQMLRKPPGDLRSLQGYEPENITYLVCNDDFVLKRKIIEEEFLFGRDLPIIHYFYNGDFHEYHPDFAIKNTNVLVETKSTYIFNQHVEKNICKFVAVPTTGNILEVFIFKNKTEIFDVLIFSPPNCFHSVIRNVGLNEYSGGRR